MTSEQALAATIDVDIEIKQVDVGNFSINYIVAGEGPPLLLIHGANIGWGQWYPNIAEFAKHFTVYAIDLPGAGRSMRVDYSKLDPQKDLFEVVDKFIQQQNLQTFSVAGTSIGGWIALKLARKHGDKIKNLILVNTVGFADYMGIGDKIIGFYPLAKFITKTVLKPHRGNKNIEKFIRGVFFDRSFPLREEFIEYFYETMETSHNLLFISRLSKLTKDFMFVDQLPEVKNRTLIVWGQKDKVMSLDKNKMNFQLLPNMELQIISDAGHFPSIEKHEEFNQTVLSFLKSNI